VLRTASCDGTKSDPVTVTMVPPFHPVVYLWLSVQLHGSASERAVAADGAIEIKVSNDKASTAGVESGGGGSGLHFMPTSRKRMAMQCRTRNIGVARRHRDGLQSP
jgi:hypothetical protein